MNKIWKCFQKIFTKRFRKSKKKNMKGWLTIC